MFLMCTIYLLVTVESCRLNAFVFVFISKGKHSIKPERLFNIHSFKLGLTIVFLCKTCMIIAIYLYIDENVLNVLFIGRKKNCRNYIDLSVALIWFVRIFYFFIEIIHIAKVTCCVFIISIKKKNKNCCVCFFCFKFSFISKIASRFTN